MKRIGICVGRTYQLCCGTMTSTNSTRSNDDDDDDDEFGGSFCSICLQSLFIQPQPPETLSSSSSCLIGACIPCGHCFHSACFNRWEATSGSTICPVCKTTAVSLLDLKYETSVAVDERTDERDLSKSGISIDSSDDLPNPPSTSFLPYAICANVPCGHCFLYEHQENNNGWEEFVTSSIREHEGNVARKIAKTAPVSQPHDVFSFMKCQSCSIPVAAVLRLFIETPLKCRITNFDSPHPSGSNEICASIPADAPSSIVVTQAGNPAVNGVYFYSGMQDEKSYRYIRCGMWYNMLCQFNIFVCHCCDETDAWFISVVSDFAREGSTTDIDFYAASITDAPYQTVPPRDGWLCPVVDPLDREWEPASCPPHLWFDYCTPKFYRADVETSETELITDDSLTGELPVDRLAVFFTNCGILYESTK